MVLLVCVSATNPVYSLMAGFSWAVLCAWASHVSVRIVRRPLEKVSSLPTLALLARFNILWLGLLVATQAFAAMQALAERSLPHVLSEFALPIATLVAVAVLLSCAIGSWRLMRILAGRCISGLLSARRVVKVLVVLACSPAVAAIGAIAWNALFGSEGDALSQVAETIVLGHVAAACVYVALSLSPNRESEATANTSSAVGAASVVIIDLREDPVRPLQARNEVDEGGAVVVVTRPENLPASFHAWCAHETGTVSALFPRFSVEIHDWWRSLPMSNWKPTLPAFFVGIEPRQLSELLSNIVSSDTTVFLAVDLGSLDLIESVSRLPSRETILLTQKTTRFKGFENAIYLSDLEQFYPTSGIHPPPQSQSKSAPELSHLSLGWLSTNAVTILSVWIAVVVYLERLDPNQLLISAAEFFFRPAAIVCALGMSSWLYQVFVGRRIDRTTASSRAIDAVLLLIAAIFGSAIMQILLRSNGSESQVSVYLMLVIASLLLTWFRLALKLAPEIKLLPADISQHTGNTWALGLTIAASLSVFSLASVDAFLPSYEYAVSRDVHEFYLLSGVEDVWPLLGNSDAFVGDEVLPMALSMSNARLSIVFAILASLVVSWVPALRLSWRGLFGVFLVSGASSFLALQLYAVLPGLILTLVQWNAVSGIMLLAPHVAVSAASIAVAVTMAGMGLIGFRQVHLFGLLFLRIASVAGVLSLLVFALLAQVEVRLGLEGWLAGLVSIA